MRLVHAKDVVTLGNIGIGLLCSVLALEGHFQLACYFIILAFVFDHMDGKVAKWTGMTNQFGKELDNIADLISYTVAPAFIVYAYYRTIHPVFGFIMAMLPLSFGCIRFARNNVYDISFKGFWLGFPRPVSAFFIISLIGSHLNQIPYFQWIAIPFIALFSYANLSFFPFMAHYGRSFSKLLLSLLGIAAILMIASFIASMITFKPYVMDMLLFQMSVYTVFQFLFIDKKELEEKNRFVQTVHDKIAKDMTRRTK